MTASSLSPDASFAFVIDPAASLALARFEGVLTGEDMRHAVTAVHADPAWRPTFDAIWDCARVRAHVVGPQEVAPLVAEVVEGEGGRDVLIESANGQDTFFSEMLAATLRMAGKESWAVESMEEALATLGLDALPVGLAERVGPPR